MPKPRFLSLCLLLLRPSGRGQEFDKKIRPILDTHDDVRWRDLRLMDLRGQDALIRSLTFNAKTIWPTPDKMPAAMDPNMLVEEAKNPGLGLRDIHRQGVTGRGVNTAIIDQNMFLDHPEFAGKIVEYKDFGCGAKKGSMHAPAVASLLAGETIGAAPGAKVYHAAVPSWYLDASYYARALDWILEVNGKLPAAQKIRVVSVSAAPSGKVSGFKNREKWDQAVERAKKADVMVLDCTETRSFVAACVHDPRDPENPAKCAPVFGSGAAKLPAGHIFVPSAPRTLAEEYDQGAFTFQYDGRGGQSWAIPYCAGVLALGWQVRPDLTKEQMLALLLKSAAVNAGGDKVINPKEFIRMVREFK